MRKHQRGYERANRVLSRRSCPDSPDQPLILETSKDCPHRLCDCNRTSVALSDTFVVLGTVVLIGSNTGSEALFWLRAAAKFGPVLVPPLCAWILVAYGWRKIFFIFAVPGIVLSVIWYVLVKNRPSESPYCSAAELRYIESGAQAIHPCMVGQACTSQESETTGNQRGHFSFLGYLGIIARLFLHDRYYDLGIVAAAPWTGAIVGNIVGGWFSDKIINKRRKPNMMFTAFTSIFMIYSLIYSPNDPYLLAALMFVLGVFMNIGFSTYMVYPMGLTTKKSYPIACSVVNMSG